ncbi:hypothetical protein EJB05_46990, partial [Eragrostis curvula]
MARLPDVLRLLLPRSLAVVRCVCKLWRDIIDADALLLPHSVRGVFFNYVDHNRPHLFSRPTSSSTFPPVDGLLSFLPNDYEEINDWWTVLDHCNGLVLCNIDDESRLCVCNPATKRWLLICEADLGLYAHHVASLPYENGRQLDGSWMVEE